MAEIIAPVLMLRPATPVDVAAMAAVQNAIYAAGGRVVPATEALVAQHYIDPPDSIACTLAEDAARVVGFQSSIEARPGNLYGLPEGWGIIGTHIHPQAGRSGLGRRLFAVSLAAARRHGPAHIDAAIGADNTGALAYYAAMGFRRYDRETGPGVIPHRLDMAAPQSQG